MLKLFGCVRNVNRSVCWSEGFDDDRVQLSLFWYLRHKQQRIEPSFHPVLLLHLVGKGDQVLSLRISALVLLVHHRLRTHLTLEPRSTQDGLDHPCHEHAAKQLVILRDALQDDGGVVPELLEWYLITKSRLSSMDGCLQAATFSASFPKIYLKTLAWTSLSIGSSLVSLSRIFSLQVMILKSLKPISPPTLLRLVSTLESSLLRQQLMSYAKRQLKLDNDTSPFLCFSIPSWCLCYYGSLGRVWARSQCVQERGIIQMNNYHIYEEEGRGKHSIVFKARKKKSLEFVAIKQTDRSQRPKVVNECKILLDLSHANVLKFHDWIETKKHLWVITEYCPGGDLLTLIEQDKSLPEHTVRVFTKEIMSGLQYLHSSGIVFSDLKPANIFINQYGNLKLADLGCAKRVTEIGDQQKKGTPCYMSPELFDNGAYSFQSDLWALGCIMYELAQGNPPFLSSELSEIMELAQKSQTPRVAAFSDSFNDLLLRLLDKQPQNRITWRQIVRHPWLKGDIELLDIPEQPHFDSYLKSEKQPNKLTAHKIQEQNYQKEPINTSNRRELLNFGETGQVQGIQQMIEKETASEKKQKTAEKKKTRMLMPQLDDSSNINIDVVKISRHNLVPIQELLVHQSDNVVKPIIGNKDIETPEVFSFSKNSLGFDYIQPQDLIEGLALNRDSEEEYKPQMESELKKIYEGLLGENKIHVIGYFETLIQNSDISNFFIKSKFIPLFLKLIKTYKQPLLRAKICEILGLIIRHATIIESDILKFGITNSLIEVLADKSEKVRRKAMAALGEFLFYAATQVDEGQDIWDLPNTNYNAVVKTIKNTQEDQIARFYAVKTIENITAQTKVVGSKFTQIQVCVILIGILNETKLDLLKTSAASSIHHIVTLNENLVEPVIEKLTLARITSVFENNEGSGKILQVFMGLINMQLYKKPNTKISKQIYEDEALIRSIIQLLDCQSSITKGRVMLFLNSIIQANFKNVIYLQEGRFFQSLEKQFKDGHKYIVQCLHYVVVVIQENISTLLKLIKGSFQNGGVEQTRRKGVINSNYANLIVSLLNCSVFQETFQNTSYIDSLFSMLDHCEDTTNEPLKNTIFQICEKVVSNNKLIDCLQQYVSQKIFPLLMRKVVTDTQASDIKFGCMKLLIYLVGFYMPEECMYNSIILQSTRQTIIGSVNEAFFPVVGNLLQEKEPIPSFTLKILALLFELHPTFLKTYKKYNPFSLLSSFYSPSSSKLTQHTLKIIHSFCLRGELTPSELLGILESTKLILSHYIQTVQDLFLEYPLDIIAATIKGLCEETKSDSSSQINSEQIFELVLPLQGYDDVEVRQKAINVIKLLLSLNLASEKGKWVVIDKQGLQNYLQYLKVTNTKPHKEVYQRVSHNPDKTIQSLLRQIDSLC